MLRSKKLKPGTKRLLAQYGERLVSGPLPLRPAPTEEIQDG
jgi:hypothetical protein